MDKNSKKQDDSPPSLRVPPLLLRDSSSQPLYGCQMEHKIRTQQKQRDNTRRDSEIHSDTVGIRARFDRRVGISGRGGWTRRYMRHRPGFRKFRFVNGVVGARQL